MNRSNLLTLSLVLGLSSLVLADTSMPRQDAGRTGMAHGQSDIRTPAAYWRMFLGGAVKPTQAIPVTISGHDAIVFVVAGRVHASTVVGAPLWQSERRSLTALHAVVDLDGDGQLEVVAQSVGQVFVLDLATGALRWEEVEGEMGTIGGVRVTDLDLDGLPDILIEECNCCQLRSGDTGYVYGFADGFASPRRLWRLPFAFCGGTRSLIVDDIDGDLRPDVLLGDWADFKLLDGATGAVLAASPNLGTWVGAAWCAPVELDGMPGKELVCVHGTELETAGRGHRMFALRYATGPARLEVMWSLDVGDRDGRLGVGVEFLRDLDGDGTIEASVSGTTSGGDDVTLIVDAHTGEVLATLAGNGMVGTVDADDRRLLLTKADNQLLAWSFDRLATPTAERRWLIKDRRVLVQQDWSMAATTSMPGRLVITDADGDGDADLITIDTRVPGSLRAHSLSSADGDEVGTWNARTGAEVLASWGPVDGRITLATSDGRLTSLSTDVQTELGSVRAGGYYATAGWEQLEWTPVTGDLNGDGTDEVLIADSRKSLVALDVEAASHAAPPAVLWERERTFAPSIVPGLGTDGGPAIACRRSNPTAVPPNQLVAALDPDGTVRWQVPLAVQVFNDVVHGNFDGDGVPDLTVQWGELDDTVVRTTALSGSDGQLLWTTTTQGGVTRFPAGAAVFDHDGDGIDDVIFHHYGTRVLSGVDGAQIAIGGPTSTHYFMPTVTDVTGDGVPEISLHGGFYPSRTLSSDLATEIWASTDDDRPYPYAAVSTCPAGPVLVGGSLAQGSRLKVTLQAGESAGSWQSVVLASGQLFVSQEEAAAAGALGGQLTSVHVHENLTGLGHPSAVVGSSDGWLYAVDPCTMALDFALQFDAPVGAVAFADGDGDGLDEIIVSVADGYLYGVKHAPIFGPGEVRDLDPSLGSDEDVDEITTRGTLAASWDPVAGADGYEVTVALADGGIILSPAWQRVGTTSVTFTDLPLEDGVRYVFSVRALLGNGVSPDVLSDGVLVHLTPAPDAGVGPEQPPGVDGGCCSTQGRGLAGNGLLAVLASVFIATGWRHRRRRA